VTLGSGTYHGSYQRGSDSRRAHDITMCQDMKQEGLSRRFRQRVVSLVRKERGESDSRSRLRFRLAKTLLTTTGILSPTVVGAMLHGGWRGGVHGSAKTERGRCGSTLRTSK
jgi:hypothetical protein